jgi:bzd-type benzoyl-CoA reductase N subunit
MLQEGGSMSEHNLKGIAKAQKIYSDRSQRVKELKVAGAQILGYMCIYPVVEIISSFDLVPYRIFGSIEEPITKADNCLPTCVCPFLRSALDLGLKGKYDFLDGVVMAHPCEVAEKLAHIWRTYMDPVYSFYIDTPHATREAAIEYHKESLKDFQKSLEVFLGKGASSEKLKKTIEDYNEQRALVRELYDLKKPDPPLISGVETIEVLESLMSIPVKEGNELIRDVIEEIKERRGGPAKGARVLIWGSIIDSIAVVKLIEDLGANVVMDDTCVGSRFFFPDVETTGDPLYKLPRRYLVDLKCPRTFIESGIEAGKKDYAEDLALRFGYLGDYVKQWNIKGVVLYALRFCDTHAYEVVSVKDYLSSLGIPSIYLEHDYSATSLSPLKTRVQAFLETLGY